MEKDVPLDNLYRYFFKKFKFLRPIFLARILTSYVIRQYLNKVCYIRTSVIPKVISSSLEHQDLPVLYEIRDLVADLISTKEVPTDSPSNLSIGTRDERFWRRDIPTP